MNRVPSAIFSSCTLHGLGCPAPSCSGRLYRYLLRWPTGLDNDRIALGLFANPSTADATKLDPTLTRWRNYCRDWGYGWAYTVNVRAWRATDPKDVPTDPIAVGPDNLRYIREAAAAADLIVAGYGKLGGDLGTQMAQVAAMASRKPVCCLQNIDHSPAHPLYLPKNLAPKPFIETKTW